VTVLQVAAGLADRQAAEAVRARIDGKDALGLDREDPGFDFSVLCEFRARLVDGSAEHLLLDAVLDACQAKGFLKARGRQRPDSTHVLALVRQLSRRAKLAATVRARASWRTP
jgi:transposase